MNLKKNFRVSIITWEQLKVINLNSARKRLWSILTLNLE